MCTVLLLPGDNPIAVNKYIYIYIYAVFMELFIKILKLNQNIISYKSNA